MPFFYDLDKNNNIKIRHSLEISEKRKNMSFDTFDEISDKHKQIKDSIMSSPIDSWFVLHGTTGNGKSHMATSILRRYVSKYPRSNYKLLKFRDIGSSIREEFKNEKYIINDLSNYDYLVIEEVGKGYNSSFETNLLFEIVDNRYENRLPTIITTNMELSDFSYFIGIPTFDRLKEVSIFVHFDIPSYRVRLYNANNRL